jgi:CMP-N-acetylneuraminic acid synthetase
MSAGLIYGMIPARKGSVGVAGKNKRPVAGRPLIEYAFESAQRSKLDRVFLSTNDDEIIDIAKTFPRILVEFKRPEELSGYKTEMIDVVWDLLKRISAPKPEAICILQPTSPLRHTRDIDNCLQEFRTREELDSVISVREVGNFNPYKMKIVESGYLQALMDGHFSTNRQALPKCYVPNGAVFLTRLSSLQKNNSFFGSRSFPYEMSEEDSINIDSEFDLKVAEMLLLDRRDTGEGSRAR